jgi:hypothetical protein
MNTMHDRILQDYRTRVPWHSFNRGSDVYVGGCWVNAFLASSRLV